MKVFDCRNVHEVLEPALDFMNANGVERSSRNGSVLQHTDPVATVYQKPCERVMFHPWRDANPFFHFYESLWMLGGRNDVEPLKRFVKRMESFSDDGKVFNAAYGHRWRQFFGLDQLHFIIDGLKRNPECRRQVLQIWDVYRDLGTLTKDAACNTTATFQIGVNGRLNLVVFCRSNDIIWGCYGANAVHFSFLLEYVANCVNVPVGTYTQISVNWHAYSDVFSNLLTKRKIYPKRADDYWNGIAEPFTLINTTEDQWHKDLSRFLTPDGRAANGVLYHDIFFNEVASPIVRAHDAYKDGDLDRALKHLTNCSASDWRLACEEWIERRINASVR